MQKISILMPVYNGAKFIEKAIKSILDQSYTNFELIIINDASKDNTSQILQKYTDSRIHIINNNVNKGCYCSLNEGLLKATGEIIGRIDADDTYHKTKLEEQMKYLETHPKKLVVFTQAKTHKLLNWCLATTLIRKKVFDKIGFFDSIRIAGDYEFRRRIIKVFGKSVIGRVKKILYNIGHTRNSLSRNTKTDMASLVRIEYKKNFIRWQAQNTNLFMNYPLKKRPFKASKKILP